MYLGSQVDVYTRMQNLTSEPKARTVKLHPSINSLTCLGAYDILSEIRKRKCEFVCRGAEFKLRLIVLRTCTCGVISHLYRNKLDVAKGGRGSRERRPQWEIWGARSPLGVQGQSTFRGVSLPLVAVQ